MQKKSTLKEQGENLHTVFANNFATLKKNDKNASKPVARYFNLPNHSTHNIRIYGPSLHQGKTESRKNVANECFNSTLLTLTEPTNASRSTNFFINSNHHLMAWLFHAIYKRTEHTIPLFAVYSAANDPRPQMIPRPEMIPKLDRKWSRTANDPRCGPQMFPAGKYEWHGLWFLRFFLNFCSFFLCFSSTKR